MTQIMDENRNPWQVTGQTEIYENPWIKVTEYKVINPSGGNGIYGKVFFKNTAIGIVALDDEMNTWLVGQFRFALGQYSWELPEGGGPLGVSVLASAKRELQEETGMIAKEWKEIQRMHLSNSVSDEECVIFLATGLEFGDSSPEETEELQVKKLPFDEVYELVKNGTITDSVTVAAILKVKLMILEDQL